MRERARLMVDVIALAGMVGGFLLVLCALLWLIGVATGGADDEIPHDDGDRSVDGGRTASRARIHARRR